ncbi:hypothetical protein GCM10010103_65000 [Streptomyces paradoxus]|uniref:Uncharacterized protein n=1 Tax=Streptomyces paradoxus TaxID=66375 RepID=A0A7W9TI64_9ACTN|nr:hypothetical protein [Streptomyces paradoxus]
MSRNPLETLIESLERNAEDWASLGAIFLEHAKSDFLAEFIHRELDAAAKDSDHVVRRGVGQASFTLVNTPDFEYSIRILGTFSRKPRMVKWLGMPQIIAVKGPYTLTVRNLEVPSLCDIEQFVAGVQISECSLRDVQQGDILVTENRHRITDICAATGPMIAQILTYRRAAPNLVWTFSPELTSLYCEQSSITASRFRNVMRIAHAAGVVVPNDIYEMALTSHSPQVVLTAIQSMLASGHPDSFTALHSAAASDQPGLREGANAVLDALFSGGR